MKDIFYWQQAIDFEYHNVEINQVINGGFGDEENIIDIENMVKTDVLKRLSQKKQNVYVFHSVKFYDKDLEINEI